MKNPFRLMTIFMGIIGGCVATLVVFILAVYPNINNKTVSQSTDTVSQSSSVIPVNDNNTEIISPDNTIGETNVPNASDVLDDYSEPETKDQNISAEYKSALGKANDYNNIMHMSKAAIYDQLISAYGEGFSPEAAQYAVDNMTADWNANALLKANDYSNTMYMSKAAIYDQLISEYGERFTPEEAQYAVDNMTADWNANALQKAKDYSDTMYMSKATIYDQLISDYGEKFTPEEAQYAINNL